MSEQAHNKNQDNNDKEDHSSSQAQDANVDGEDSTIISMPIIQSNNTNVTEQKDLHKKNVSMKDVVDMADPEDFILEFEEHKIEDGIQEFPNDDLTGRTTITFKDNKKNGLSQIFEHGRLVMEMNFLDNLLDGFFKYYFPNKALQMLMNYKNGKLHGEFIQYHPNGVIQSKTIYQNGFQQGLSQTFDVQQNLVQEAFYKDGLLDGPMNIYHEGELVARTYYKEGVEMIPEAKKKAV